MKRYIKSNAARVVSLALCLVMALALIPGAFAAPAQPAVSKNLDRHGYDGYRARTIDSYLYENSFGGLTRVEYIHGSNIPTPKIVVEDYDSQFRLQASRTIPTELFHWGGFYHGKDYNFLIFGQDNMEESDNKEVVRVVKYSKDWKRLGQASLYGENTTIPFRSGSLRCAEGNGWLYIRTSHQMYKSEKDGLNHQASMMIALRQSDMGMIDSSIMSVTDVGYVSHSFNQFVLVDSQNRIVSLDHGDGYPRALFFQREEWKADRERFGWYPEEATLVTFPGKTGANTTGCSVGGFAETSNGYVAAYSYDGKGGNYARDLYVDFIGEDLSVKHNKISSGAYFFTPVLAPAGQDGGYVLWQDTKLSEAPMTKPLSYLQYDANGNVGATKTAAAALSDCAPIYWNGKVVWYVTNESAPIFYTLDEKGIASHAATGGGTPSPVPKMAYANTQTVLLDGQPVVFQTYALKDANGGLTNYIKLRDLAYYLNGTNAQFSVDWSAAQGILLTTGRPYTPPGHRAVHPLLRRPAL